MNISKGSGAISKFADVCASRGRFAEAAKIYDAWENWDGDRTPLSIRWKRRNAKMSFLAKHKSRAEAKALFHVIVKGLVTPCTLADVLEDLL